MRDRLTPFQRELLDAFFAQDVDGFYLTGGAALAGFHLGHRTTEDLDLFANEPILERGDRALRAAARSIGAEVDERVSEVDYKRRLVRRGDEALVVDLVHERTRQRIVPKPGHGRLRIDPPEEIVANKLCTLLSRAEPRDYVDVMLLDRAGFRVEDAIAFAQAKDGGVTPAQLRWVLGQVTIRDDARLPADVSVAELRAFVDELRERLARLAFPSV